MGRDDFYGTRRAAFALPVVVVQAHEAGRSMVCDDCDEPAVVTLTAAYKITSGISPEFGAYPAPMARLCGAHITTFVTRDQTAAGATPVYVLTPVAS
jgi:hypothetical protein